MLIDAHAHLDMYGETAREAVDWLEDHSVLTVSNALDPESYRLNLELAERSPFVVPTFGVHPWKAHEWVDRLDELHGDIERTPMLGELGLDHRFVEDPSLYPAQRTVLEFFLEAAARLKKTVTLHTAGAEAEVLEMLDRYGVERAIVHWYAGPIDLLKEFVDRGTMLTVSVGILYYDHFREIAAAIPEHLLLTETDNPGGIEWLKGEPGRPELLLEVLDETARARGSSRDEVADIVERNFARFICGDPHMADVCSRHFAGTAPA